VKRRVYLNGRDPESVPFEESNLGVHTTRWENVWKEDLEKRPAEDGRDIIPELRFMKVVNPAHS